MHDNVMKLTSRRLLTEPQVRAAVRYQKRPGAYKLPPSLHAILKNALIDHKPLEQMERDRAWPQRSAKAILAVLLDAIQETNTEVDHANGNDITEELQDTIDFLAAEDRSEVIDTMHRYGLSQTEARIFLMLLRSPSRILDQDTILRRLYHDRIDELPEGRIVAVWISKMRKKIAPDGYEIKVDYGAGYQLTRSLPIDHLDWYARHVHLGEPIPQIAAEAKMSPTEVQGAICDLTIQHQGPAGRARLDALITDHISWKERPDGR